MKGFSYTDNSWTNRDRLDFLFLCRVCSENVQAAYSGLLKPRLGSERRTEVKKTAETFSGR